MRILAELAKTIQMDTAQVYVSLGQQENVRFTEWRDISQPSTPHSSTALNFSFSTQHLPSRRIP
jgi:hypothetical protein